MGEDLCSQESRECLEKWLLVWRFLEKARNRRWTLSQGIWVCTLGFYFICDFVGWIIFTSGRWLGFTWMTGLLIEKVGKHSSSKWLNWPTHKALKQWSLNPSLKESLYFIRNGPESKVGKFDSSGDMLETTDWWVLGTWRCLYKNSQRFGRISEIGTPGWGWWRGRRTELPTNRQVGSQNLGHVVQMFSNHAAEDKQTKDKSLHLKIPCCLYQVFPI